MKAMNYRHSDKSSYSNTVLLASSILIFIMLLAFPLLAFAQTQIWVEDFEGDWTRDWSVDNGTWDVGIPTSGPNASFAGQRCAATVLAGDYVENANTRLFRHTSIIVPAASDNPRLRFWHWYSISANDVGYIQIKGEDGQWQTVSAGYTNSSSDVWTRPSIDLSPYAGQTVQIGFFFQSRPDQFGRTFVSSGWYIDEVTVITGELTRNDPEGWETDMGDWVVDRGTWQIGMPTTGPGSAYAGNTVAATVLDGNYHENVDSRLICPPFIVPAASDNPRLRFWHWYSISANDVGYVQIKGEDGQWRTISAGYTNSSSDVWTRPSIDLSPYAGQIVQIGFFFQSRPDQFGRTFVSSGWYIDEVTVVSGALIFNAVEGWEGGLGDWAVDRGTWHAGVPESGPDSAFAGDNAIATVLGGDYHENVDSRLVSPPFTIPPANRNPRLRFRHWYSISANDSGYVQIKSGNNDWETILGPYTGESAIYTPPSKDLSPYAGQTVQIGFFFHSRPDQFGRTFVSSGWYVDEVKIDGFCSYTVLPSSVTVSANGRIDSISVATETPCSWIATSNEAWITIVSGANGSGNGSVLYQVAPNSSSNTRTGTIEVAGQIITIEQSGTPASRVVRIINSGGSPGGQVVVPIELEAQGNENALGFSLQFDPTILENPQATLGSDAPTADLNINTNLVTSGKLGLALALPSGQSFTTGTREIAIITFDILSTVSVDSTTISFADQPITREVVDMGANALTTAWHDGTITIFHGFEADVLPRPNGDGRVTIADWVQVGRFAAGLSTIASGSNEFQRADCAPRLTNTTLTLGNGAMGIADWVQAGRYAAQLDTLTPAGGPFSSSNSIQFAMDDTEQVRNTLKISNTRSVQIDSIECQQGKANIVTILLEAEGDENAIGFSIVFDPAIMAFDTASVADGVSGAFMNINNSQVETGRIGFALALPAGQTFDSGKTAILNLTFEALSQANLGATSIVFDDQPIVREIVDSGANTLSASWNAGEIIVTSIQEINSALSPTAFSLSQNYPNPFNPSTTIEFALPQSGHVTLKIFDLIGREVAVLADQPFAAGSYKVDWDAGGLESGMYFYRLQVGSAFSQTKKLVLMK